MGRETADSGTVSINKDIQVVLFDQEIDFSPNLSIIEFMMTLYSTDSDFIEKALADMEVHKAWDLENEMKQILSHG